MVMELRPYQQEAVDAVLHEWDEGKKRTLAVMATGTGKTIVFAKVTENRVRVGDKVLVLAHRGELLDQASDKIYKTTGLRSSVEKAEQSCMGTWNRVVVGSVQTLMRDKRLAMFPPDYFGTIIVDEAHHAVSDSYQHVLNHFPDANVLGVTATPDRSDMRNMGTYFESLAYEYGMAKAIKDGYLCKIMAQTIPLNIDIRGVGMSAGDYKASDLGSALDPYLESIAVEMEKYCKGRKTVVFLPLVATSQKFRDILQAHGFKAAEVNGNSDDRADILSDFDNGKYDVLCNSMLLCLDEETEILTDKGFVGMNEMTYQHKVANWNFDGTVFFENPKQIVKRMLEPSEHMVSVDSKTINFRVTNTHRMIVGCGKNKKDWKKISAEELKRDTLPSCGIAKPFKFSVNQENRKSTKHAINNTVYNLIKSGKCTNCEEARKEAIKRANDSEKLKYKNPSELTVDECKFIGFWIADGSVNHLKTGGVEYTLCQSKSYPIICNWVDSVLQNVGIDNIKREKKSSYKSTDDYYVWSIPRGTGRGTQKRNGIYHLEPYLKKDGTYLFWGLNEKQFDALVEGYWYGDGFHGKAENGFPDHVHATDTNKKWIDLLCSIGSVRGWRCSVSIIEPKNINHHTQYGITMIKNAVLNISDKTVINHEKYNKNTVVWCVRTTSKNIITRRHGKVTVMGNTEGWDCPSVDCIIVLRATKSRGLYQQMVGRGTRLNEGKDHLLLLDFLWMTERHDLCRPANLIAKAQDIADKMTDKLAEKAEPMELEELEQDAESDVVADREKALAEELAAMRKRKRQLVDPLQFAMSIQAEDLANYIPTFPWELEKASDKQLAALEKFGIFADEVENAGKAKLIMDKLTARRDAGLATPKQIRFLERKGFVHVGTWQFADASKMISRISACDWKIPKGIKPAEYVPEPNEVTTDADFFGW